MLVYLGLGSNFGDRRANLTQAIDSLEQNGVQILQVSPVVESPAWLPQDAPSDWHLPFLNLVLACHSSMQPAQLREVCKRVQNAHGRTNFSRWAPRAVDIDLLLWGDQILDQDGIRTPHPHLLSRNFVLSPLTAIAPGLRIPGHGKSVLAATAELPHHLPLWMGILNITPDSFSDGGQFTAWDALELHVDEMVRSGVHVLDVGAESTRPGARPLTEDEEWRRLQPMLKRLIDKFSGVRLRPQISVDTYHPQVAARALHLGADIINDVSGLTNPEMISLARECECDWIAMHHVSIPASKDALIPTDVPPMKTVEDWLMARMEVWALAGLDLNRIIFDPGVGFGKDALQSLALMRHCADFRRHGLRLLVGHSRKSFMKRIAQLPGEDRDLITLGASLNLCAQGVDIIRVHDVPKHVSAYRGWSHLLPD